MNINLAECTAVKQRREGRFFVETKFLNNKIYRKLRVNFAS